MKRYSIIPFCLALIFCMPVLAAENAGEALQVSRQGDLDMSCGNLSHEAANMRDIIYSMEDVKDSSTMQGHGVTAAGAVGSFLIGSATGGIGLAVGGLILDHSISEREEKADHIQDTAAQRRTLMMGIYNAKGCYGPLDHAMQNPQEAEQEEPTTSYRTASRTPYND